MPEIVSVDDGERPDAPAGVQQTLLVDGDRMNAQHVRFAPGASAPSHSHPHEQVTYAEAGETVLTIDGEDH